MERCPKSWLRCTSLKQPLKKQNIANMIKPWKNATV